MAQEYGIALEHIALVGCVTSDIGLMNAAATGVVASGGSEAARFSAQLITESPGGHGAIREVVGWISES